MQKKIFWLLLILISLVLDFTVSLLWSAILTIPAIVLCWWIAFQSGWFE